jgi:TolA-binding protein
MIRLQLAGVVAGLCIAVGCTEKQKETPVSAAKPSIVTREDVDRAAQESKETTAAYSQQNKEKLVKDLKDQLATMDENIAKLRVKGEGLASDAKASWDTRMAELDVKRKAASEKLNEIESSTARAWSDVEKGARSAWEDLKTAFQNASNEFSTQ